MLTKQLLVCGLGVFLRLTLRFSSYFKEIESRVEISTPVNEWKRVKEGLYLKDHNISPYDGDTFHESPLFLRFYELLLKSLSETQIAFFFVIIDIVTAYILSVTCCDQLQMVMQVDESKVKENAPKSKKQAAKKKVDTKEDYESIDCRYLLVKTNSLPSISFWVFSIYMLSPYSMLACVAQTTSVLANCLIAATFLAATRGHRFPAISLLALLTFNSFYPVIFIFPVVLLLEQIYHLDSIDTNRSAVQMDFQSKRVQRSILWSVFLFLAFYSLFLLVSFNIEQGSSKFLQAIYVYVWSVGDLTPNIGLFWYFFTEMFDHFRIFFLWVFQINYIIYSVPLTATFRNNPSFLAFITLMIYSIFRPYPSISDFALYLTLLPQWGHLFEYMKSTLVISCTMVTTSILAPILFYLWHALGTANANFYFGMTLGFNVAQIFLITDLMFSFVKREFYLDHLKLYQISQKTNKPLRIELGFE